MEKYFVIFLLFLSGISTAQILPDIDAIIKDEMGSRKIPALAVAVIESGKVVHLSADGFRDIENNLKVNINTPFHIASVSKIVVNLAIFKLIESGKIKLDSDINDYLSFEIRNPHLPNEIITVGEVLKHRSGILDNHEIYGPHWHTPNGDPEIKLSEFLRDYLNIKGKLYSPKHYAKFKEREYSNTGYALLGLVVENISGTSFEEFTEKNIFKPLKMVNTGWFLKNFDAFHVAKTYVKDKNSFLFKGHNGYPDYPAGQLRTSISDYSKLIIGYLNSENDSFILKSATINQITPSPRLAHKEFYTWGSADSMDGQIYFIAGGDVGVRTFVLMDIANRNALIIFANSEVELGGLITNLKKQVFK